MPTARPQPHKSPASLAYAITHSSRTLQHNYPPPDTNELGPATCSKLITAQHGPPPIKTMTAFVPLPPPTNLHCPLSWCRSHLLIFHQNWNQTHGQFVSRATAFYANASDANTKHFWYMSNWYRIAKRPITELGSHMIVDNLVTELYSEIYGCVFLVKHSFWAILLFTHPHVFPNLYTVRKRKDGKCIGNFL